MRTVKVFGPASSSQPGNSKNYLAGSQAGQKLPIQFRRMKRKDPVESIEERLNHIQKALSILPPEEADTLFLDIVSRSPEEIFRISQPYIDKSYSLKLIDSRSIQREKNSQMPALRIPFAVKYAGTSGVPGDNQSRFKVTTQSGGRYTGHDGRSSMQDANGQPYTRAVTNSDASSTQGNTHTTFARTTNGFPRPLDTAEEKFKSYIDNFCELNEQMYSLNQQKIVKPAKIKERLPVKLSEKTQAKWRSIRRRELLNQLKTTATRVNLDLHKIMDADLYGAQGEEFLQEQLAKINSVGYAAPDKAGVPGKPVRATSAMKPLSSQSPERLRGKDSSMAGLHMSAPNLTLDTGVIASMQDVKQTKYQGARSLKQAGRQLHEDDYLYDKNYGYYVHLNTDLSRNFKMARDKYKTGVYLGRTPAAGEELHKIKSALKPFYTALPMSNLNIVKEFHRVYKEIGSKLRHKARHVSPDRSPISPHLQSLAIGAGV